MVIFWCLVSGVSPQCASHLVCSVAQPPTSHRGRGYYRETVQKVGNVFGNFRPGLGDRDEIILNKCNNGKFCLIFRALLFL